MTSKADGEDPTSADVLKDWMRASGFNGKQVAMAGASIGMQPAAIQNRHRGVTDMPRIETLGLTAAFLGFPPWAPGFADALDDDARAAVRIARREIERCIAVAHAPAMDPEVAPLPKTSSSAAAC